MHKVLPLVGAARVALVAAMVFVVPSYARADFAFTLNGPKPNLPSGTQSLGVSYSTGVTLKKSLNGSLRYFTEIDSASNVGAFFGMAGIVIPYAYNFEIVKSTGGSDNNLYIIPDEVQDLTGITGVDRSAVLFAAGADHSWNIPIRGFSASSGGSTGTVSYDLVFRIYDTNCAIAKSSFDATCIVFQLPLQSSTVTWVSPAPPPTPAAPPIHPMVNNRPSDRNPPLTLPTTSGWPVCNTGASGQNCACPAGGC